MARHHETLSCIGYRGRRGGTSPRIGGVVGQKRTFFSWRFVVDFAGGQLPTIGKKVRVKAIVEASRGEIVIAAAWPLESIVGYQASLDLQPNDDSVEPVNVPLFLSIDGRALIETWLYQWAPPNVEERKRFL